MLLLACFKIFFAAYSIAHSAYTALNKVTLATIFMFYFYLQLPRYHEIVTMQENKKVNK